MEVEVTTEAIRRAKLQLDRHHQQTNTQFFYRPDALPVAKPTATKNTINSKASGRLNKSGMCRY